MAATVAGLWRLAGEGSARWIGAVPGAEVRVGPDGFLLLSGAPVADFNWAYVAPGPGAAALLREYARAIRARGVPTLLTLTEETAAELAPLARELGFAAAGSLPLLVADAPPAADAGSPGPYRVRRVADAGELAEAARLLAATNGLAEDVVAAVLPAALLARPDIALYVARRDDEPVSAVLTTDHGDTVGIWCMVTPPALQRRGAGRALLTAVLAAHARRGATRFYLGSTEAGLRLYTGLGFAPVGALSVWVTG